MVGQGLPTILAAYASVKRIQTFLEMEEKREIAREGSERPHEPSTASYDREEKVGTHQDMSMDHASFSWLPDSPVVLDDISLSLDPGKLHMCVGPVAAVRLLSLRFFSRRTNVTLLIRARHPC